MRIMNLCLSTIMVSGTAALVALGLIAPGSNVQTTPFATGLDFAEFTPGYVHDYDDDVMGQDAVATMMTPAPQGEPEKGLAAAVLSQLQH